MSGISSPSHERDFKRARALLAESRSGLMQSANAHTFLPALCRQLGHALNLDCFMQYETAAQEGKIRLLAGEGFPDVMREALTVGSSANLVCGEVYGSGHPIVLTSLQISSDKRMWWARGLGLRSYAGHPLVVGNTVVGTLAFASGEESLTADTVAVLAALSEQVSMAMSHWKLEAQAKAEAKRGQLVFLSVLAHELRNPMAPIRSGVDIARSDTASPEAKSRALSMMDRQLSRMTRLVDDLLNAARIDSGTIPMRMETVLLDDVVGAALESVGPALEATGQRLVLRGSAHGALVNADPLRLSQAISNILNNCAEFSPPGEEISVKVLVEAGAAEIEIADRGNPVAETELPGVFRLSAQANRRSAGDGMGVGLAMAQTLVERQGGSIWAENRFGEPGVRFLVRLPIVEGAVEAPAVAASAEREPLWAGDRVLVVDDNEDAADALCMLFEMKGKTVRIARDGLVAVEEAQAFRPDYIWMDIGLPGISGIEATRRIRALGLEPRPFICALTGLGQAADREATAEAGCDLHLTKPIQVDAALAVMSERRRVA